MGPRPGRTKTAVDTIFVGKGRAYNRRFQQMCGHYLVDPPSIVLGPMADKVSLSKTCFVRFDENRYSVDPRAVGRPVEITAYADRFECWQDGRIVGNHLRVFGRDNTVYDPLHYIPVLACKPGALRNGAPFKEWELPVAIRRVQRKLKRLPDGDR